MEGYDTDREEGPDIEKTEDFPVPGFTQKKKKGPKKPYKAPAQEETVELPPDTRRLAELIQEEGEIDGMVKEKDDTDYSTTIVGKKGSKKPRKPMRKTKPVELDDKKAEYVSSFPNKYDHAFRYATDQEDQALLDALADLKDNMARDNQDGLRCFVKAVEDLYGGVPELSGIVECVKGYLGESDE